MNNPLLKDFQTPYDSAPFSIIKNDHFLPAFEASIKEAKKEVDQIVANPEPPNFENTLAVLEFSGNKLKKSPVAFAELIKADFGAIICFGLDVVPEVFRTISFESSIQFRINSPKCVSFTLSLKIKLSANTFIESIV